MYRVQTTTATFLENKRHHVNGKVCLPTSSSADPPLSTKTDAEKMSNIYLEKVRQRLAGKLRIGIPSVTHFVYVEGTIGKGLLVVPSSMFPCVGEENALMNYSV